VALSPKDTAEMMRPAAGLHRYNAWPQLARKLDHSLAMHASPQHNGSAVVEPHDAAAVLAQINPENRDFHCLSLRIGCPKTLCPQRWGGARHPIKRDGGWGGRGMRYSASEKLEIIRLVEQSHLPVRRTLGQIGIPRSTFYRWYDQYQTGGPEALDDRSPRPDRVWNRIPDEVRSRVVTLALDEPELSPRELAVRFTDAERYFVSEASVYRLLKAHDLITSPAFITMKAADEFKNKTTAPNQLWQTDFTYLKVTGWGWFYLSTILDDFSRYIIAWKLCTTMKAEDVTDTLKLALQASGLDQATVMHRPRLLSDNGSSYVSGDLAKWLERQDMRHTRGAPYHPMTQGKIERWHQTLKNRILLENYYLPGDLEAQIDAFVAYYNHRRYHESIDNLTPADVYFGRSQTILLERERIKRKTIQNRRLLHHKQAA
jgi:transposase InsO family protein